MQRKLYRHIIIKLWKSEKREKLESRDKKHYIPGTNTNEN